MYEKYFAKPGDREFPQDLPGVASGARRPILYLDKENIPETSFTFECSWLMAPFEEASLMANENDAMLFMNGDDKDDPENLFAEIELTMDNDVLNLTETCAVYIPAGCAHKISVKRVDHPVMFYYCEFGPAATRKPAQ